MTDKEEKEAKRAEKKSKAAETKREEKTSPAAQTPTNKDDKTEMSKQVKNLIKDIESLSVLELADLIAALEDKFGVSAAVQAAVPAAPATTQAEEAKPAEAKDTFTVVITDTGSQKIQVIKAVRALDQTLGLKEAKDKVESTPAEILTEVKKEEAEEAKKKLEEAGAKVELK